MGKQEAGTGVVSLANAFYFAGVPSTVGSLWSTQDKSSSDIISVFYSKLKEGETKSKSLQSAKLNYLENADKIKGQPFFWANYVIYGNDLPLFEGENNHFWIWGLIAVGLIGILLFLFRYLRSSSTSKAS